MKRKITIIAIILLVTILLFLIGIRIFLEKKYEKEYENVYIEIRHDEVFVPAAEGYKAGHTSYEITKNGFVYCNKEFIKKINQNNLENIELYIDENVTEKREGVYPIEYYVKMIKDGEWKTFEFDTTSYLSSRGYNCYTHLVELINE